MPQTPEKTTNLTFGEAINAIMCDKMVRRTGWNGKGMFIYKTIGNTVSKDFISKFASLPLSVKSFLEKKGQNVVFNPSITMYTAQGEMQPGWLASQADVLALDWEIVE